MKAVITRVSSASVSVNGAVVSSIGPGILALIGIGANDLPPHFALLASKILALKLFPSTATVSDDKSDRPATMWKRTLAETNEEILCVSQFTLYSKVKKGNKLDFHAAMSPTDAKVAYDTFLQHLRDGYDPSKVKDGIFGAMMSVASVNEGPITILLDTDDFNLPPPPKPLPLPKNGSSNKKPIAEHTSVVVTLEEEIGKVVVGVQGL